MSRMSQEEINVGLFDEVTRLKAKLLQIEDHCIQCNNKDRAISPNEILDIIKKN